MQFQDQRLKSFSSTRKKKKFPSDIPGQSYEILSKLGFYHTPTKTNNYLLSCFFCSKTIDCSDMHPLKKHLMDPCSLCLLYSSVPGDYDWNQGIQKREFQIELLKDVFVGLEWPYPNNEQQTPTIDQMVDAGLEHTKRSPDCIVLKLAQAQKTVKRKGRPKKISVQSKEPVVETVDEPLVANESIDEDLDTVDDVTDSEVEKPKKRGRPKKVQAVKKEKGKVVEEPKQVAKDELEKPRRGRKKKQIVDDKKDIVTTTVEEHGVETTEHGVETTEHGVETTEHGVETTEQIVGESENTVEKVPEPKKRGRKKKEVKEPVVPVAPVEPKKRGRKKKVVEEPSETFNQSILSEASLASTEIADSEISVIQESDTTQESIASVSEIEVSEPKKRGRKKKLPTETITEEKPKAKRGRKKKESVASVQEDISMRIEDLVDEKQPSIVKKSKRGRPRKNPVVEADGTQTLAKPEAENVSLEKSKLDESILKDDDASSACTLEDDPAVDPSEPARKKAKTNDAKDIPITSNTKIPKRKTELSLPTHEQISSLTKHSLEVFNTINKNSAIDLDFLTRLYLENQQMTVGEFHDLICDHVLEKFDAACQLELDKFN
ncbi:hypothetical protein HDV01_003884 [Terramyces sp. JEL0728]|nr:hypothetical protein HDV01_003884 [Terramyces sp. JEL0728]